jgi:hypothetical protein
MKHCRYSVVTVEGISKKGDYRYFYLVDNAAAKAFAAVMTDLGFPSKVHEDIERDLYEDYDEAFEAAKEMLKKSALNKLTVFEWELLGLNNGDADASQQ